MNEEELQDKIEKGLAGNSADDNAYRRVFDALKREPTFQLPADFAGAVLRKRQPAKPVEAGREIFWIYAGIAAFVIAAGISIFLTGFTLNFGVLRFLPSHAGLVIFGIAFIIALQWVDKRFIKRSSFN